ncbi:MAG TPA: AAA family ATPase [Gemmataceae bacterium]|nr:AAA family ATPase [Gemmataceae bacterium]
MPQPELPREEQSQLLRRRLREIVQADRCNRIGMGEQFSLLEEQGYWRDWGYPDFAVCTRREFGLAPSTARQLIKVYRTLVVKLRLPHERVQQIAWSKAVLVIDALTPENVEGILSEVERLSYQELKRKYQPGKRRYRGRVLATAHFVAAVPAVAPVGNFRRPKPPEDRFWIADDVWEQAGYAVTNGQHVLLLGHSGCGKTALCGLVAEAYGRELVRFNCGAMSEPRSTLIGNTHLDRDNGTWFQPSVFVAAVQRPGTCILLDELSRAPREAFNILLPLLDGQRYLALDDSADAARVPVAPGVTFLATANLGAAYTGADQLDWALFDRFPVVIEMDFPPAEKEAAVLAKQCPGLAQDSAALLVEFACRQRELARETEFTTLISTRSLLAAARQAAAGVALANAIRFTIVNRFSDEGGDASERTKLLQLLQKVMG